MNGDSDNSILNNGIVPNRLTTKTTIGSKLIRCCAIGIGGLLLYSALTHLINPYDFVFRVLEYQILDRPSSVIFSTFVSFLQLIIATALLFNFARLGAWFLSFLLFAIFATAQLVSMARGLNIDCGCFGFYSHQISWFSISAAVIGCLVSLACGLILAFSLRKPRKQGI